MPTSDSLSTTGKRVQLRDGRSLGYAEYGDPEGKPLFFFQGTPSSRHFTTPKSPLLHRSVPASLRWIGQASGFPTFRLVAH
jgi:hypothetical protein